MIASGFKKLFVVAAVLLSSVWCVSAQTRQERLREHLYYFASDSLRGRMAGSEDAAKAAEYIIREYSRMGLKPYFDDWYMPFETAGRLYRNVIAVLEGSDPALRDEYIVLGAHYDHVGVKDGEIYNGADDNASGSSALIEIARELCERRSELRRSVIIAAFDAEELGLYGSNALAEVHDISRIKLMMSVDMVGWYRASGYLKLMGTATIRDGRRILSAHADEYDINLKLKNFETSIMTATDTRGFALKGVPTIAATTGLKSPYHKPEDDAELRDYEGLDKVSAYLSGVAIDAASDPEFAGSGRVAAIHGASSLFNLGLSLGAGSSHLHFPDAAFEGKPATAVAAGLLAQVNLLWEGRIGIRGELMFTHSGGLFLDENDIYNSSCKYSSNDIIVPVQMVFQTKGRELGCSIGVYGRRGLSRDISGDCPYPLAGRSGYGFCYGLDFVLMKRIGIGFSSFAALGDGFFEQGPEVYQYVTMFNVKWYFR